MNITHPRGRNAQMIARVSSRLDYAVLVATVQAGQLSTATARAAGDCGNPGASTEPKQTSPLTQILLGAKDWQQAVLAQQGSFNPFFARGAEQW
jgi:hypothetical protein